MSSKRLIDDGPLRVKAVLIVLFVLIGIFMFFPMYWMVLTALRPSTEIFSRDVGLIPIGSTTLANFRAVIGDPRIARYMLNSVFVSGSTSVATTLICAYAGYSFSKYRYPGRRPLMFVVMTSQMFPFAVLLLTIYVMMRFLGLLDRYMALVLSYVTFTLPVGTWTLKSFFDHMPDSLIESAKIDGASRVSILHRIILPLTIPGMISVAVYGFVWSWNDLLYALTLITSPERRTLAPGLVMTYMGEFQRHWATMMAASVWVSVPVTVGFVLLQRFFVQGLTAGALKG